MDDLEHRRTLTGHHEALRSTTEHDRTCQATPKQYVFLCIFPEFCFFCLRFTCFVCICTYDNIKSSLNEMKCVL